MLDNSAESKIPSSSVKNRTRKQGRQVSDASDLPPLLGSYLSVDAIDCLSEGLVDIMYTSGGKEQTTLIIDFNICPQFLTEVRAHCNTNVKNGSMYIAHFFVAKDSCKFPDMDDIGFTLPGPGFSLPSTGGSIRNLPICVDDSTAIVDSFTDSSCLSYFKTTSITSPDSYEESSGNSLTWSFTVALGAAIAVVICML